MRQSVHSTACLYSKRSRQINTEHVAMPVNDEDRARNPLDRSSLPWSTYWAEGWREGEVSSG